MGLEIVYVAGAFVLLVALIYATLAHHYRDRNAVRAGEDVVRDRYRKDET
jgi:hypothetical protein